MKKEGRISKLVDEKGYGFIQVEGYEKDIFFHAKDCRIIRFEQLRKGDMVCIGSITPKEKGNVASDVTLAN